MTLRSAKERLFQAVCYELGGLALAAPFYHLVVGGSKQDSLLLMTALSVGVLCWAPVFNLGFDLAELRWAGRVASDRPQRWRVVHAISYEATTVMVTLPILVFAGGHGWWDGLVVDLALTLVYMIYAYVFYMLFDWLRPVEAAVRVSA